MYICTQPIEMDEPVTTQTNEDRMVLRTVYLPPELDAELRKIAFDSDCSKGDLIRESIRTLINSRSKPKPTPKKAAKPTVVPAEG